MTLQWYGPQVTDEIRKLAGLGLHAAAIHASRRLKEVLSVPAPRKRVVSKKGVIYYRATTPATPGAPPRKLSGRLRASVTQELSGDKMIARVGSNIVYGRRHEFGTHPWLIRTILAIRNELAVILGRPDRYSVSGAQSNPRPEA